MSARPQTRRYKWIDRPRVSFDAWALWEGRQIQIGDVVSTQLAALRLARLAIRKANDDDDADALVSNLFSDEELPYRHSFSVKAQEAEERLLEAEHQLAIATVVLGVAALDDFLKSVIRLLRQLGIDTSDSSTSSIGLSEKLGHLNDHGSIPISLGDRQLHDLLLAIRNDAVHPEGKPHRVRDAWCEMKDEDERPEQEWWEKITGRPLPLTATGGPSRFEHREIMAALRLFDRLAASVNHALRDVVSDVTWATLAADELERLDKAKLRDPTRGVGFLRGFLRTDWLLELQDEVLVEVLQARGVDVPSR